MPKKDPRVDALIAGSAEFARPILKRIRNLVLAGCPDVEETIKWGFGSFVYRGSILCQMAPFKNHCTFQFWHRHMHSRFKLASVSDLPEDAKILALVKKAMGLIDAGIKPHIIRKPAKKLKVPADLAAALKQNKIAADHFQAMSASHQNEYVEWIVEAKRPETREKRLVAAMQMITEGKSRHWKYQK